MVGLSNDQLTSGELEAYTKKVCAGQPKGFPFDCDVNDIMVPDDAGDLGYPSDDDEVDEEEIQTVSGFECVIGGTLWAGRQLPLPGCLQCPCQNFCTLCCAGFVAGASRYLDVKCM